MDMKVLLWSELLFFSRHKRDACASGGTIGIDNLSYGYATTSNKLMSVVDNSNNTSGFNDFNKTGDDYVYDANGNMTVDKNKKITSIVYNHLNLPTKIIFTTGNIVYIYNASGQKVQKVVTTTTPASVVTTDYLGGYQYKNAVLQFFPTAEGYVKNTPVGSTNAYSYVFNYTDHLGNVRLSYTKNPNNNVLTILEESNYYPFGLKHNSYNVDNFQPEYKYKFQEQERQDELGLNWDSFKYRNYDYAIGRFMCIDPLAEDYTYNGPYNFAENRVIDGRELEGLEWVPGNQTQQWNAAFKEMGQSFAGAIDKIGAKVSAFFSISRDTAPNTKVVSTTTATAGTNVLNFVNAKQFDQNTTVSPFTAKVETKVEVKVTVAEAKAKVEGLDVSVKASNVTNVTAGTNKTEVKATAGIGSNGVFATNTTNNKTGENTTRAGVQLQAETPKVQNTTITVGISASIGQEEKKKSH